MRTLHLGFAVDSTVKEILDKNKGLFAEYELYRGSADNNNLIITEDDGETLIRDYSRFFSHKVIAYGLLNEQEYNEEVNANYEQTANFELWLGDKNAKALVMVLEQEV